MQVSKSNKLANVCYDIRGPVLKHAKRLEEEGHRILKLNIGNPAPFGFEAPEEILQDVIRNLPTAQGYSDSKGLFSARKAIMHYTGSAPDVSKWKVANIGDARWCGLFTAVDSEIRLSLVSQSGTLVGVR